MTLIIPRGVQCPHLGSMLVGQFTPNVDTGEHRLAVVCTGCQAVWDEETVPIGVVETIAGMIAAGTWSRAH